MPLKTTEERLDGQRKAIITLREEVRALKKKALDLDQALAEIRQALAGLSHTSDTTEDAVSGNPATTPATTPGGWYMKPTCLSCGQPKGEGRETKLSCLDCGRRYIAMIRGSEPKVMVTVCGWCGATKKPSLNVQCAKCAKGFQRWKEVHTA